MKINKIKSVLKDDRAFTLIELITVIAIMVILISMVAVNTIRYIQYAKRSALEKNAKTLYDTVQIALINAKLEYPEEFYYAVKYVQTFNGDDDQQAVKEYKGKDSMYLGRFTNMTLRDVVAGKSIANKSAASDIYIAQQIQDVLSIGEDYPQDYSINTNPMGKTTLEVSQNPDTYGKFAFAIAYDENCEIIYLQVCYNGYFYRQAGGKISVEPVSDDISFSNWPNTKRPEATSEHW